MFAWFAISFPSLNKIIFPWGGNLKTRKEKNDAERWWFILINFVCFFAVIWATFYLLRYVIEVLEGRRNECAIVKLQLLPGINGVKCERSWMLTEMIREFWKMDCFEMMSSKSFCNGFFGFELIFVKCLVKMSGFLILK